MVLGGLWVYLCILFVGWMGYKCIAAMSNPRTETETRMLYRYIHIQCYKYMIILKVMEWIS